MVSTTAWGRSRRTSTSCQGTTRGGSTDLDGDARGYHISEKVDLSSKEYAREGLSRGAACPLYMAPQPLDGGSREQNSMPGHLYKGTPDKKFRDQPQTESLAAGQSDHHSVCATLSHPSQDSAIKC